MFTEKYMIEYCGNLITEATEQYKKEHLTFSEAMKEMENGCFISISDWQFDRNNKDTAKKHLKRTFPNRVSDYIYLFLNKSKRLCKCHISIDKEKTNGKIEYKQYTFKENLETAKYSTAYENLLTPQFIMSKEIVAEKIKLIPDKIWNKKMNKQ